VLDVEISNVQATGAKQAFSVNAYPNDPLKNFTLSNLNIQAQTAGTIANAEDWTFKNVTIKTVDASQVVLKDCTHVVGLAGK
jgi:hypothetical protein